MSRIKNGLGGLPDVMHEVVGGVLRRHAGIHEPDQVRNGVIAKDHVHLRLIALEAMNGVELFGQFSAAGGHDHRVRKRFPGCGLGLLRRWPSTSRPDSEKWPRLLPKRYPPTAIRPEDEPQKHPDADSDHAAVAPARPRDGENDSGAKAVRGSKPRPCWYRRPGAESGDRTRRSKFQCARCCAAAAWAGKTLAISSRSRAITKRWSSSE